MIGEPRESHIETIRYMNEALYRYVLPVSDQLLRVGLPPLVPRTARDLVLPSATVLDLRDDDYDVRSKLYVGGDLWNTYGDVYMKFPFWINMLREETDIRVIYLFPYSDSLGRSNNAKFGQVMNRPNNDRNPAKMPDSEDELASSPDCVFAWGIHDDGAICGAYAYPANQFLHPDGSYRTNYWYLNPKLGRLNVITMVSWRDISEYKLHLNNLFSDSFSGFKQFEIVKVPDIEERMTTFLKSFNGM